MGGTCCKPTLDPNRVHIKKINEIFLNCNHKIPLLNYSTSDNEFLDLKNQGI